MLRALIGATLAAAAAIHGIDIAGMDHSTRPGDDFFKYANGTWEKQTAIPPDHAAWGVDSILADQATAHTRELLEAASSSAAAGSDERKAADYYAAYLDEAAIEARGLAAVRPALSRVEAIDGPRALAETFGSMLRADVDPLNSTNFHTDHLFGLWVAQDFHDPSHNTAYLLQGGLAMPDRDTTSAPHRKWPKRAARTALTSPEFCRWLTCPGSTRRQTLSSRSKRRLRVRICRARNPRTCRQHGRGAAPTSTARRPGSTGRRSSRRRG